MKPTGSWWLVLALLLSLGINLGLVWRSAVGEPPAPPSTDVGTDGGIIDGTGEVPDLASPTGAEGDGGDAGPPMGGPGADAGGTPRPGERLLQRMADDLGLEGAVRERFLEHQRRFLEHTLRGRRRIAEIQRQLRQQVTADEPDPERIDELLQASARTHYELEKVFIENLLAGREVLDDEQERHYVRMLLRFRQGRDARRMIERRRFLDRPPGAAEEGRPRP